MKYTFTFKEIQTQRTICIASYSHVSISYFVKCVKTIICEEFQNLLLDKFDIVEAGHYNNSNGWAPELADKLEVMYNENDTIEKIYSKTWKNTSFYIRTANAN